MCQRSRSSALSPGIGAARKQLLLLWFASPQRPGSSAQGPTTFSVPFFAPGWTAAWQAAWCPYLHAPKFLTRIESVQPLALPQAESLSLQCSAHRPIETPLSDEAKFFV